MVPHIHPRVAWYRLLPLYQSRRDHCLVHNDGYSHKNYTEILVRFSLSAVIQYQITLVKTAK
jgi:fatty acid desaturase